MRLSDLRRRMAKWQRRLRIADWTIKLEWGETEDFYPGDLGISRSDDLDDRQATILLRRRQREPEATLLHELLHIGRWEGEEVSLNKSVKALMDPTE